jgi:beta-glucosidase
MVGEYVRGVLSTGTQPTLKHFAANNTEFHRHRSNSVVDERTLHEIYLPAFKAGIDAGALAVMTGYNLFDDEWCSENRQLITGVLKGELAFKGLVMTDWGATENGEKLIKSGVDLEMPSGLHVQKEAMRLIKEGKITEGEIDQMAQNIIRTEILTGLLNLPTNDRSLVKNYPQHVAIARRTEAEGAVLLKNSGVLPLAVGGLRSILLVGSSADKIPRGGGSSEVEGFDPVMLRQALTRVFGKRIIYTDNPSDQQLASAGVVLVNISTADDEGWDHPFALPENEEMLVRRAVSANSRTVVIVSAGSDRDFSEWNDKAAAVLLGWYPGQAGNLALADIISGRVNPSGKLPFTIEKHFEDSPGHDYLPVGAKLYSGWSGDADTSFPIYDVNYREGVFVGYRWYEAKKILPLYAFGHGLSYTRFEYSALAVATKGDVQHGEITISFDLKNIGHVTGAEVAQLYIGENVSPVARPKKELKSFSKIELQPGESSHVSMTVSTADLGYWDVNRHAFHTDAGHYRISIAAASDDVRLCQDIDLR